MHFFLMDNWIQIAQYVNLEFRKTDPLDSFIYMKK